MVRADIPGNTSDEGSFKQNLNHKKERSYSWEDERVRMPRVHQGQRENNLFVSRKLKGHCSVKPWRFKQRSDIFLLYVFKKNNLTAVK